jgi:glucose/arabinose dehydrogenase
MLWRDWSSDVCSSDLATTEIYTLWHTLSLHDALPISPVGVATAPDGSLLVSDDGSGSIWRVSYTGK